jgi:two-component system, OmpR family, sensor histidine kinase CiaH
VTAERTHDVRRLSIRVALTATGLVAIAYLIVSLAVVALVTRNLTQQIDDRLNDGLSHVNGPIQSGGHYEPPPPSRPGQVYGPRLLVWTIDETGSVFTQDPSNPALPLSLQRVTGPQDAQIGGADVRIQGRAAGDDYVVVAQTLDSVAQAQSQVIRAELLIGPLLLIAVFIGAVAVGRRVATPIERARRRQLEFTADASHELRTPLSVIEAQTSLALSATRDATWYRTAFQRVDLESQRMRRLLDDLLWLARFDATQAQPDAEPVDLGVLAAQTADRFGVIAETRHLALELRIPPDSLVVTAPPEWLDRLLGVLLDNACKYSPEGGTVTMSVAAERNRIAVTVDDAGPGIPEAERARIFDRFHRATDSTAGAGLGLAIADAIVRATGGQWRVAAAPTGGARMTVSWPRAFAGPRESVNRSTSRPVPSDGPSA